MTEIELYGTMLPIRDLVDGVTNVEVDTHCSGPRVRVSFANGYGASVVRNMYSYGGSEGLWELAVLGSDGSLTYATPLTDDVIGHLDGGEVIEKLREISALTAEVVEEYARALKVLEISNDLADLLNRAEAAGVWITQDQDGADRFNVMDAESSGPLVRSTVELAEGTRRWGITS
jgi:hypothetical protein